jgi:hypothetical protein
MIWCWIFGHRFVPVAEPIGNDKTAWHTTTQCMRCGQTKRIEL